MHRYLKCYFFNPGVTRHDAQQWCLAHAFELVELNPQELPDEDGETGPTLHKFICTVNFIVVFVYPLTLSLLPLR